jgi:hypothetical protein
MADYRVMGSVSVAGAARAAPAQSGQTRAGNSSPALSRTLLALAAAGAGLGVAGFLGSARATAGLAAVLRDPAVLRDAAVRVAAGLAGLALTAAGWTGAAGLAASSAAAGACAARA